MGARTDGDDGQARRRGPQRRRGDTAYRVAGPGTGHRRGSRDLRAAEPFGYKALSGTPFPGYAGEVRLTRPAPGTHISYTVSSTASFPLVKAPLAVVCQVLLRLLARASTKQS